jgi:hypothetical protein
MPSQIEDITFAEAAEYINEGKDVLKTLFTDELPPELKLDICIGFMLDVIDQHFKKEDPNLSDTELLKNLIDLYADNFHTVKETIQ